VWPIALALIVGLLVGFAGGYAFFVSRDRAASAGAIADATATAAPTATEQGRVERPAPPDSSSREIPPSPVEATPTPSSPAPSAPQAAASSQAAPTQNAPAADERATRSNGRVSIRSTPPGARVSVDGRDSGVTPLTLPSLARGTHVIRLTHQGYVAAERRVRIGSTQSAQSIEVALVATRPVREAAPPPASPERTSGLPAGAPGAKVGSLMVDSRPAGARVLVDGKLVGTTPLLLDSVAVGDHSVRLELDGFNSWTAATRVTGGERTRVSGSLEQQ